jgi:hypothetical protein
MSFVYINPKNKLKRTIKEEEAIKLLMAKVSEIPKYQEHKHCLELQTMLCVMTEHLINNQKKQPNEKIDKKNLVIEAYKQLFHNVTPQDLTNLSDNIEYLYNNNKIKKVKITDVVSKSCIDWIKRKIL